MPRDINDDRDDRDQRDELGRANEHATDDGTEEDDDDGIEDDDDDAYEYDGPPHYEEEHRGTLILVLGILSIAVCPVLGVAPWLMASGDLAKMDSRIMDPEGRSLTKAGKILGIVALCQFIFGMVLFVLYIVALVAFGMLR